MLQPQSTYFAPKYPERAQVLNQGNFKVISIIIFQTITSLNRRQYRVYYISDREMAVQNIVTTLAYAHHHVTASHPAKKISLSTPTTSSSRFLSSFLLPLCQHLFARSITSATNPAIYSRYTKFTRVTKPPRTMGSIPLAFNFVCHRRSSLSYRLVYPNNNACIYILTHVRKRIWYYFGSGQRESMRRMQSNESAKWMVKSSGTTDV